MKASRRRPAISWCYPDSGPAKTTQGTRRPGTQVRVPGLPRQPAELNHSDSLGLRSAVALCNLEFDPLTFFKRPVAVRLNCREVDEDVPTTVDRDEAVALIRVEPFDGALSHEQQLPNFCSGFGSRPCYAKPVDRGTGLTLLRKLCLPFSPYRQRPDITLHGHDPPRTAIPVQVPSGVVGLTSRWLTGS